MIAMPATAPFTEQPHRPRVRRLPIRLAAWLIRQERHHAEQGMSAGWDARLSQELDGLILAEETLRSILGNKEVA